MKKVEQTHCELKERQDTSPVLNNSGRVQSDAEEKSLAKLALQSRGEKTSNRRGLNIGKHSVFVLDKNGKPLTPTTPARARKLLKGHQAKKAWSKFGTFGIQMLVEVGTKTPQTIVGVDHGTKFEGYSVVVDQENNLNVKLDLPSKINIHNKMNERKNLRRSRRFRKCRRRPARFKNRSCLGFIPPSQEVIINSRIKIIKELIRIYPIKLVSVEDVRFNHWKYRWGSNFSTIEIGKNRLRKFYLTNQIMCREYRGYETKKFREFFGYNKVKDKSKDCFESHCSDSLALACAAGINRRIEPGPFLVVDDTYRPVRRCLHDAQPNKGGIRKLYSKGTIFGLRKGLLIGTSRGYGRLCGTKYKFFRYYDSDGKRQTIKTIKWISSSFIIKNI